MVALAVGAVVESSSFKTGGGIGISPAVKAELFFAAATFLVGFFFLGEILVEPGDRGVTTVRSCCCVGASCQAETEGNSNFKGHGTTNDAVLEGAGNGDSSEEHTPKSNWANNSSSSSNDVLSDRMEKGS